MRIDEHAEIITESIINGQYKQAQSQWHDALYDNCAVSSLISYIRATIGDDSCFGFCVYLLNNT